MSRYVFVGQSSPVPGREAEYEDWYLKRHLPAMLQCAGVVSVRRFRCVEPQLPGTATPHRYLAIYEIDSEAPEAFVKDMLDRAIRGVLPSSGASAPGSSGVVWEELSLAGSATG
jgi:hypothetical protein